MADSQRKKRLEKSLSDPLPKISNQKFYCCRCGTAYSRMKGNFPVSHSPMYRGSGFIPMCNDCVDDLYEHYRKVLEDDKAAMKRICMKLDLYWHETIYEMVTRTAGVNSRVRNYIGKSNIIRYVDKTYDNTLEDEERMAAKQPVVEAAPSVEEEADSPEEEIDQSVIDFWGRGYDTTFYNDLNQRYEKWTSELGELTPVEEALYKQVCLNEVIIARLSAKGQVADKATKNLMDALSSLNIKPSQVKSDPADVELEKMPLGVGIQTWEYQRPLPITPDNLKDQSNAIKNITTWFLGHAGKMVGLKNSHVKLYENAMNELRVKRPEYADEDDDTLLVDIFGETSNGGGSG